MFQPALRVTQYFAVALATMMSACIGASDIRDEPVRSGEGKPIREDVRRTSSGASPNEVDNLCGREPSKQIYAQFREDAAKRSLVACAELIEPRVHVRYLRSATQPFPLGFGLESAARDACLGPESELRGHLRSAGICSEFAMAIVVLRCLREQSPERCDLANAVQRYYSSSEDAEWRALEGEALPPRVMTTRHGQRVSDEFQTIVRFLDYLADHVDQGPYDPKRTQEMDPNELDPFLAPNKMTFSDVNWPAPLTIAPSRIRREVVAREGKGFVALTQLGWVYAFKAPQLAYLDIAKTDQGAKVVLPEHYALTFERWDGGYRLVDLKQLMESDL